MDRSIKSLCMPVFLFGLVLLGSLAAPNAAAGEAATSLKLIVYGASGRVGSRVVDEALKRSHRVTAVSRDPAKIKRRQAQLTVVEGSVLDRTHVARQVIGQDAVVVAVRGSLDDSGDPARTVHYTAVQVLVEVLRDLGAAAPRLIFVGGAGSLEVEPGVTYWESLGSFSKTFIPDFILQEIQGHLLVLDYLRGVDDVRWTYMSPPKTFKPGERTGKYRIGRDTLLRDSDGKSRISMEDYAVALIDEAENSRFPGQRFTVVGVSEKSVTTDPPGTDR